ncbi:MAG: FliA/WhiG family RNA polymerase sigma factor [Pseudomonadota bacterium]
MPSTLKIIPRNQNKIIQEYSPLIKFLAGKIVAKSRYSLELNEMMNCGVIGLIDAIKKYDKSHSNQFKTYAEYRIKGAMLDYLRDQDTVSRTTRDKIKLLNKTSRELEEALGRKPSDEEMRRKLHVSQDEYFTMAKEARSNCFICIDDKTHGELEYSDEVSDPLNKIESESTKRFIANAIETLPEKEKVVVALYYYEEMNLKEIGDHLGVSESRASQIHSSAVSKLKSILYKAKEDIEFSC